MRRAQNAVPSPKTCCCWIIAVMRMVTTPSELRAILMMIAGVSR
jgi:hypothetical protein